MNWRPWLNRYGSLAVLLALLFVLNPELRAFLFVTNFIGVDLMIFLIAIQLRVELLAIRTFPYPLRTTLCVAGYASLSLVTRLVGVLLAAARVTTALTGWLFVVSTDLHCPLLRRDLNRV
jgi:hypothetical protein